MTGLVGHPDCGAEVVLVDGWLFERVMRREGPGWAAVEHVCRDYVAWHRSADGRDPWTVDVGAGWVPRPRAQEYAPAA